MSQYLLEMRDVNVQKDQMRFRRNLERVGEIMAYEISKTMRHKTVDITTPLATAHCQTLDEQVVLGTIFRAGVPFHQGFLRYFDYAENAFISAYRKYTDNENFDVCIEYLASPKIDGKTVILCDPMLATGSSMELSYRALLTKGTPAHVHIASVIASRKAIEYIKSVMPEDTTVWVGVIDDELNAHSYIVPGLGDAGDLAYGVKE
jgi:uracil phosphoribosyltransferase